MPPLSKCPLCKARSARVLTDEARIVRIEPPRQLVKCLICGLVYVDPLSDSETAATYDAGYYRQYAEKCISPAGGNDTVAPYLKERLALLERLVGKGSVLDVGCGMGYFVEYAVSQGWRAIGLDISRYVVEQCRARGLEVHCGTLEQNDLPQGTLDVIHMNHTLEHLADPLTSLQQARRLLKSQGVLVVEVPNEFDDLFEKIRGWIVRKPRAPYAVPTHHVVFFNAQTFKRILILSGFAHQKIVTITRAESLQSTWVGGATFKRVGCWIADHLKRGQMLVALLKRD